MNLSGKTDRWGRAAAACLVLVTWMAGCEQKAPRPEQPERPPSSAAPASAPGQASASPEPGAAAGSAANAASAAPSSASPMQGTWEGAYDAKKGSIVLPPKVKDAVHQKDDGKVAAGPGTVTVTIGPDGELRGSAKGALGSAQLTGKVEEDMIRASVFPDDPRAPNAMTGILVGQLRDGVIHAQIRVTGPDATLIRESTVELKKK